MNEQEYKDTIDKACRILTTYQNKICKGYKWVEGNGYEGYSDTTCYTVVGNRYISKVKRIEAIESYNEKNPDNKIMVNSERYETVMNSLKTCSRRDLRMTEYHTPYLHYALELCSDIKVLDEDCFSYLYYEDYKELTLSVANIDEDRLASIEFCEKDRQELLDEKFDQLSQQLLIESEKKFKKKTDKLMSKRDTCNSKIGERFYKDEITPLFIYLGILTGIFGALLIF